MLSSNTVHFFVDLCLIWPVAMFAFSTFRPQWIVTCDWRPQGPIPALETRNYEMNSSGVNTLLLSFQQLTHALILPSRPWHSVYCAVIKYTHIFECKHLIKAEPHFSTLSLPAFLHLHSLTLLLLESSLAFMTAVTLTSIKWKYVPSKMKRDYGAAVQLKTDLIVPGRKKVRKSTWGEDEMRKIKHKQHVCVYFLCQETPSTSAVDL